MYDHTQWNKKKYKLFVRFGIFFPFAFIHAHMLDSADREIQLFSI